ncbi:MAG: hypothetical protein ACPGSO_05850 [Vicingaceae bacterium]
MSNFNKIIKDKVDQFEVPFNEAHWSDMEERLNAAKSNNSRLLFGSAAAIITLVISSYFLFSTNTPITPEPTQQFKSSNPTPKKEKLNTPILTKEEVFVKEKTPIIKEVEKEQNIISVKEKESKIVSNSKQRIIKSTCSIADSNLEPIHKTSKKEVETTTVQPVDEVSSSNEIIDLKEEEIPKALPTEELKSVENTKIVEETATKVASDAPVVATPKRKKVIQKAYEDENVTKKNVKRSGRRPFISFKKRLYKVPLSRRKSKKKK